MRTICHYAIARFLPFAETGEFANVGIVLFAPQARYFGFKVIINRHARVTNFFEQLDGKIFKQSMRAFREELTRAAELFRPLATDRRHKIIDVDGAFRLWEELIKPRETILRFSEARIVLSPQAPKDQVAALFHYYIERNFVTREYQEQVLERSVRHWLKGANLLDAFVEQRLGNEEYSAHFPFVAMSGHTATAAIKPLNLDQQDASRIIDHGGQWAVRVHALRKRGFLPDRVLFPVKGPEDDSPRGRAKAEVVSELKNLGVEVAPFGDQAAVIQFAQPIMSELESRTRINLSEPWDIQYWTRRLSVSEPQLLELISRVGPNVAAIQAYLGYEHRSLLEDEQEDRIPRLRLSGPKH